MSEQPEKTSAALPEYHIGSFPAPGLRQIMRHITSNTADGKAVFLESDHGEHYRFMGGNQAVANIIYSTRQTPVDLNDNLDVAQAHSEEPPFHCQNGAVVRMIDFGPNAESSFHRAMTIDFGVVIEGAFELTLDSGERRILRQGDVNVQRATNHKWKNITANGTMPGRIMFFLLDIEELTVGGKKVEGDLGSLKKEYEGRGNY